MARGTFANIRLVNKLASKVGPQTLHIPSGQELDIYDAAEKYQQENSPVQTGLVSQKYACLGDHPCWKGIRMWFIA